MTLCIAWIREDKEENKELVFATDSALTGGGEFWKHGVKLFELPRKDCLLCFAGSTQKAYTLILNLISSMKYDDSITNHHTDLREVLEYLCDVFTLTINSLVNQNVPEAGSPFTEASFIFGGWNWKLQLFEFWHIYYGTDENRFIYQGYNSKDGRANLWIGDELNKADEIFLEELTSSGKKTQGMLDMEPFLVLSRMTRDDEFRSIDGYLQVGKVYQSGESEFLGVMQTSEELMLKGQGKYTFLGRELNPYIKPQIRFIDPDNGNIPEEQIPLNIAKLKTENFGDECRFIEDCYPEGKLKPNLSDKEKKMLLAIFRDSSYKDFLTVLADNKSEETQIEENA